MKKRRLLSLMLLVSLIVGVSSTLTSCKDYDDESEWNERTATNESLLQALQEQVASLTTAQQNCRTQCDQLKAQVGSNTERIHNLELADTLLTQAINDANKVIATNRDSIRTLNVKLGDCINKCNNTALRVNGLADSIVSIDNTVKGMQNDIRNLYQKAYDDSLSALAANKLAYSADSLAKKNLAQITINKDSIAKLNDLVTANKEAIEALDSRVTTLEDLVNKIQDALKKQVTSIYVNGTWNPIFGYYAIPTGDVRSTVLGTYYGNPGTFEFPSANSSYYANAEVKLSNADLETAGAKPETDGGKTIVAEDGANGNAGTLWMTLNPLETDFTGKAFSLVNSKGEKSALELEDTKASDELLQFGYTRAGSATGLYASQATVTPEDVASLKPNVNLNDIKSEVRTLYNNWKNRGENGGMQVNLSQLAGVIYENVNNVLPALALKTTWSDASNETHNVISQYNVAAAAVHPLSFGFLQGRTATPLPLYTAYEDLNVNIEKITIGSISAPDAQVTIKIKGSQGQDSTVTTTVNGLNQLVDEINSQLAGVQSQVNTQIEDADDQLAHLSNLTSLFKTYDRWANRVNGWFSRNGNNDINRSLQPVLFYGRGNDLAKVGNAKYGTVALGSNSALLATTYTLELLAPAYKKWVAVTNAWANSNDAVRGVRSVQQGGVSKSVVAEANNGENMNKVVYGSTRHVTLGTLRSGYVYEISYAAVDYNGKEVVRKFYVRGK